MCKLQCRKGRGMALAVPVLPMLHVEKNMVSEGRKEKMSERKDSLDLQEESQNKLDEFR